MSRPKSKNELLELSDQHYSRLLNFIHSFSDDEQLAEFPAEYLNRNIRDVLAHLHHWHLLLFGWYEVGMKGAKPIMPAVGHTWKTLPSLNKKIQKKYSVIDLDEAKKLLDHSHHKITKLISSHSNKELFEKKRYKWTGSTSLGAYLVSATSSHYDWAFKLIKKCMSQLANEGV